MKLSLKTFLDILGAEQNRPGASHGRRRATRRKDCHLRSRAYRSTFGGRGCLVPITIVDISLEGIGVVTSEIISKGHEFIALLPTRNEQAFWVRCRSVWAKPQGKDYRIGAEFLRVCEEREVPTSPAHAAGSI